MLIVIQEREKDKWSMIYSHGESCLNILLDSWADVLIDLKNVEDIERALISQNNTDSDK